MGTTPKLNLTDVPFVGDVDKPGDFGMATSKSPTIIGRAARAIVAGKAEFDKRSQAVESAQQSLAEFCRGLAVQVMNIRREFINSDGKTDWLGTSDAYKRTIGLAVYEPLFGTKPEGVNRNDWVRDSGYGSFRTSLDRACKSLVDDVSALDKDDPNYIPADALTRPEPTLNQTQTDHKALMASARSSQTKRKADGPDVQSLLNTAETALKMLVEYGDPDNPSIAPGLLKLTPNEAEIFLARLANISGFVKVAGNAARAAAKRTVTEGEGDAQAA